MDFLPIKTRPFLPPKDNLSDLLAALPTLKERDIVVITSKVVAIAQGRCVPIAEIASKDELIAEEADLYIPREEVPHGYAVVTVKDYTLLSSAGIDASNANGYYILFPDKPAEAARTIWSKLRARDHLQDLGVIITDSHSVPQRRGALGISVGFHGLVPLKDYRGTPDIFGRNLQAEQANLVDALAAAAVLVMGEAAEQTPLVIIRDVPMVEFAAEATYRDLVVEPEDDIFAPIYKVFRKKRG